MKKFLFSDLRLMVFVFAASAAFTSCQKEVVDRSNLRPAREVRPQTRGNILGMYHGMEAATMWELQQARAATARYQQLENALKDGYVDINVVIPGMGRHYLKGELVDDHFDPRKPEILVYNFNESGSLELVAAEYAIPLPLSAEMPEGFTGDHDHWAPNHEAGLWLLHAWVWKYNPDGVFAHFNPMVP